MTTMDYPPRKLAAGCQCVDQPMKAMFCMTGHMMECHYPLDCRRAACNYLAKYDWDPRQVADLQAERDKVFLDLADARCPTCQGTGSRVIDTSLQEVYGEDAVVVGAPTDTRLQIKTFCACVWRAIEGQE